MRWLYGNAHIIAQELGREVGPIRPDERVKLRVNPGLPEYRGVAQRFEDGATESRRQIDLLSTRLQTSSETAVLADEYEMVIPMGTDTELVAAHTVEQIARRIKFGPEAINQIKLALVEACINATEHSLSPDRKIYQRFRVEADKLTVTITSRGIVPVNPPGQNSGGNGNGKSRRGWCRLPACAAVPAR